MKKIFALGIVALFIISLVPFTVAEDNTADEDTSDEREGRRKPVRGKPLLRGALGEKSENRIPAEVLEKRKATFDRIRALREEALADGNFTEEEKAKIKALGREQMRGVFANAPDAVKERLKDFKLNRDPEEAGKRRGLSEEKRKAAHDRFEKARSHFKELDAEIKEERKAFKEARDAFKACEDDCDELEAELLEKAKSVALKTGDMVITHLEKIKQQLESNERLSEEEVAKMLERLSAVQADVEAAISDVEAATTKEELRSASKSISTAWNKIKNAARSYATKHVNSHRGLIVTRSEQLEKKLDRILDLIEEKGIDIADLDAQVDEFSTLVASAKESLEASQAKLDEAKLLKDGDDVSSEDRQAIADLVQEARSLAKEGQDSLKEAHAILTSIVRAIHESDPSVDFKTLGEDKVIAEEA